MPRVVLPITHARRYLPVLQLLRTRLPRRTMHHRRRRRSSPPRHLDMLELWRLQRIHRHVLHLNNPARRRRPGRTPSVLDILRLSGNLRHMLRVHHRLLLIHLTLQRQHRLPRHLVLLLLCRTLKIVIQTLQLGHNRPMPRHSILPFGSIPSSLSPPSPEHRVVVQVPVCIHRQRQRPRAVRRPRTRLAHIQRILRHMNLRIRTAVGKVGLPPGHKLACLALRVGRNQARRHRRRLFRGRPCRRVPDTDSLVHVPSSSPYRPPTPSCFGAGSEDSNEGFIVVWMQKPENSHCSGS